MNARLETEERQESYTQTVRARLNHMRWFYSQRFFLLPGSTLFLFLLGMAALGYGVFEYPRRRTPVIIGFMAFGVVASAVGRWLLPVGGGRLSDRLAGRGRARRAGSLSGAETTIRSIPSASVARTVSAIGRSASTLYRTTGSRRASGLRLQAAPVPAQ